MSNKRTFHLNDANEALERKRKAYVMSPSEFVRHAVVSMPESPRMFGGPVIGTKGDYEKPIIKDCVIYNSCKKCGSDKLAVTANGPVICADCGVERHI